MYKKIFLGVTLTLSVLLFLSGCSNVQPNTDVGQNLELENNKKLQVVASTYPLYDLLREVGGDKIDAKVILPPGASPHTFEVSASQIKSLQGTKLFFINGQSLDNWVSTIINSVSGTQTFDLSTSVKLQKLDKNNPNHTPDPDEEDTTGYDPHYWLNPDNAILLVQAISNKLAELDKANKDYYYSNGQNFIARLAIRDIEWKNRLGGLKEKNIVVFHDAWGYFADHFGLTIVATFEPFPGQEPTPQYLKELQKTVKDDNIKTLFVEPQLSQDSIKTLAKDLGLDIKVLDPLGGVEGRMNYIDLIEYNVNNIYDLLK